MATKGEIERQILALQSQLNTAPPSPPSKKRKSDATVLAPATPSPRKKRDVKRERPSSPTLNAQRARSQAKSTTLLQRNGTKPAMPSQPEPPSLLTQLKSMSETRKQENKEPVARSEGFGDKPAPLPAGVTSFPVRDDRLAIVEELTPGPAEHTPPADDPNFEKVEPNSGIRLRVRVMTHEALNDYLYGRFYLPPSLLYSIARLDASKQNYNIPVEGDWVTIAVVAERGDVKLTAGPGLAAGKDWKKDGDEEDGKKKGEKGKKQGQNRFHDDEEGLRKGGKKYVNLKLVDLGLRSRTTGSSSDVARGSLKGDAQLTLILFQADHCDKIKCVEKGKERVQKSWRGGSGGAFEECYARLKEGTVVAVLNPKVLRPFQNSKNQISNTVLAITPPSASAIVILGYASDLGCCSVVKRDGKPCGAWVDRRISGSGRGSGSSAKPGNDVCDYHIQAAVQKSRAGRSELSVATSGLSSSARKDRSTYDPVRKMGLRPESGSRGLGGESTYILGGFVATSSSSSPASSMFVGEKMGKDAQERAHRKDKQKKEEKSLMDLLGSKGSDDANVIDFGDKFGGVEALDAVRIAREINLKGLKLEKANKGKGKAVDMANEDEEQGKKKYSAEMVKKLGFNPLALSYGARSSQNKADKSALSKLAELSNQKREIRLGPPPGQKRRSCVIPLKDPEAVSHGEEDGINIGSDSDLEVEPPPAPPENMDFLHSDSEDDL